MLSPLSPRAVFAVTLSLTSLLAQAADESGKTAETPLVPPNATKTDTSAVKSATDKVKAAPDAEKAASEAVTAPPEDLVRRLRLSPFYTKYVDAGGVPVVGSAKVSDAALREAARIVRLMLKDRPDLIPALTKKSVRVAVMAPTEMTTDIPEHSDLTPKDYWDKRARGLGATTSRPASSCAEENLLHLKGDRYRRENILIHEFAHTFHTQGLNVVDPTFDKKLKAVYAAAMQAGLWKGAYAATNAAEYWAEGVQSYFDCNDANNASHNDIDTREKLAKYDPALFELIDKEFRGATWRYHFGEK